MVYNNGRSPTEISHELAVFVSKFVSPPIVAIVAAVCFSLWSPIGLGLLNPSWSILICFSLFAFFPFLPVLYFYRKNVVDLDISKKEMRTPFFAVAAAFYSIAALIFFFTNTTIMFLLALSYAFVTIILLLVNRFWKVSVHSAVVTGPVFALIFVFGFMVLPLSLMIVLVSWSRIKLKKHTFTQTFVGALIPIAVGLVLYPVFLPMA
jgi:membrane-associated phospholipid phosphatase